MISQLEKTMKHAFLSCFVLIVSLASTLWSTEPDQPNRVTPQPQCVKVIVDDGGGHGSLGSGAYIGPELIVTCWHVVQDRKTDDAVTIKFPVEDGWHDIEGEVIFANKDLELAFILLDKNPDCEPLALNTKIEVGQPVSIQGYGGGEYKQDWGFIDNKMLNSTWNQVESAQARSGDSGGPVLDTKGRYVGTLWGSDKTHTAFLKSSVVIEKVLDLNLEPADVTPTPNNYILELEVYK